MIAFAFVLAVLLAFAVLVDPTTLTPKRKFYTIFLTFYLVMVTSCYLLTMNGRFYAGRAIFMATNVIFIFPAVLITGGLPESPSMIMVPLPLLYAFCLFSARGSFIFFVAYFVAVLSIMFIPMIFSLNLPNFATNDIAASRRITTFLILLALMAFTLMSLQYENQRALRKAQDAAEAKTAFLANMSHEIRTPMNGVLGLTDVLMSKSMPEDQRKLLQVIHDSGDALLTIINDILDFSKLDAGQIELEVTPFNLKRVLLDVNDLLKVKVKEKNLYLKIHYQKDCSEFFHGDSGRLRQILLNIIGNAIKFTDEGGINITVRYDTQNQLLISVRDTGIGIAPDKVEHLFEEFTQAEISTTRKFGGTGLGLSISRKLAQVMGGDIVVMSALGEGSVFTVQLPLPVAEPEYQSVKNSQDACFAHPITQGLRI